MSRDSIKTAWWPGSLKSWSSKESWVWRRHHFSVGFLRGYQHYCRTSTHSRRYLLIYIIFYLRAKKVIILNFLLIVYNDYKHFNTRLVWAQIYPLSDKVQQWALTLARPETFVQQLEIKHTEDGESYRKEGNNISFNVIDKQFTLKQTKISVNSPFQMQSD